MKNRTYVFYHVLNGTKVLKILEMVGFLRVRFRTEYLICIFFHFYKFHKT